MAPKVDSEQSAKQQMDLGKETGTAIPKSQQYRYDAVLWLFGILFLGILHSLIFGIGKSSLEVEKNKNHQ